MPKGFVYFIGEQDGEAVKIGYSHDPNGRIRQLQSGNQGDLRVLFAFRADRSIERMLHRLFRPSHLRREWFTNAESLREFADRLQTNHLAAVLRRMGMQKWPNDAALKEEACRRFDASPITENAILRAAADVWPEDAEKASGTKIRKAPDVFA